MKKLALSALILFSLLCFKTKLYAQTAEFSFVMNIAGGYGIIDGQMFDFNVGEMVLSQTFNGSPGYLLSQGFLQPYTLNASNVTDVLGGNNVITPNNDGKNDVFVIEGLDKYPGNTIKIYDRAGRNVFTATDYKNTWDGTYNGRLLNEDTYYYVIDLGKSYGLLRGFISIILDNK